MKTRLLAAAILFCVYVGAPFVAPDDHTALAASYCFCFAEADMYENNGGAYVGQQDTFFNLGQRNSALDCYNACWGETYNWGVNTVCPSGDLQYLALAVRWQFMSSVPPLQGWIGPTNVGCP
jgi:hypothetical protein